MDTELQTLVAETTTQNQATYLMTNTNISFYLKKVNLFKKNTAINEEEILSVVKNSIERFNSKMATLNQVEGWDSCTFNVNLTPLVLPEVLQNSPHNFDKTRYAYELRVNESNTLTKIYDQIRFYISFNDRIKQLSGSFILSQMVQNQDYKSYMKKHYFILYLNRFLKDHLSKYSYFELLLELLDEEDDFYNQMKANFLKELNFLIDEEFVRDDLGGISLEMLFRDLILMHLAQMSIVQSLSEYFKTANYYKKIRKEEVVNFKENCEIAKIVAFLLHIDFPQDLYYKEYKQAFEERHTFNLGWRDFYIASPVVYSQMGTVGNKRFLNDDFSKTEPALFFFLLFLIEPSYYNSGLETLIFSPWKRVWEMYKSYVVRTPENNDYIRQKFQDKIIESNFNYIAFLNRMNMLVTTEYDEKVSTTFEAYQWVQSFVSAVNLERQVINIQSKMIKNKYINRRMFFFKQAVDDIHDLSLSSIQQIYNYDWSKTTIKKFYDDMGLTTELDRMTEDLKYDDEFYKKQMQREVIIFGFFCACLIAWVDFGNMVWTVLSCAVTDLGLPMGGGTTASISKKLSVPSIFFLIVLLSFNACIIVGAVAYMIYISRKMKKISNKDRVNI